MEKVMDAGGIDHFYVECCSDIAYMRCCMEESLRLDLERGTSSE